MYESDLVGRLALPAGHVSDGESIPRLLAALAGPPCRRAGHLHDWLYGTHALPKATADFVYREALLACGIDPVYAEQRYGVVDVYGETAWETGPQRLTIITLEDRAWAASSES